MIALIMYQFEIFSKELYRKANGNKNADSNEGKGKGVP
jgi:hypothetical protein